MTVNCNYLYVTDNLLDPTHVSWVHRSSFASSACDDELTEVTETSTGVVAARWMHDADVAPFYRPLAEKALVMDTYNFMTPINEDHTRYFWLLMRNCFAGDEAISKAMDNGVCAAFEEDRAVFAAVHRGFTNQVTRNFDLASDRAPLLFSRRIAGLIEAEMPERAVA